MDGRLRRRCGGGSCGPDVTARDRCVSKAAGVAFRSDWTSPLQPPRRGAAMGSQMSRELSRTHQRVSRRPWRLFFCLCLCCRRVFVACQEFTTTVCRCAPCSRGNSAEWFHLKWLSAKPPCRSGMALRTALNNIELLTACPRCTFAPSFIGTDKQVHLASESIETPKTLRLRASTHNQQHVPQSK